MLAWLLGEANADSVQSSFASAELIVASDLTLVECDRVLCRATLTGDLLEAEGAGRRATLRRATVHWILFRLEDEVFERARRPFPVEPITFVGCASTVDGASRAESRARPSPTHVGSKSSLGFEMLLE